MKVSYVEDLASHSEPVSCIGVCEGEGEALTGERTGRVLSREIYALSRKRQVLREVGAMKKSGRQPRVHRHRKVVPTSRVVGRGTECCVSSFGGFRRLVFAIPIPSCASA
jgi:hypothetical protein